MDSRIKALQQRVRVQGIVICAVMIGWVLSATLAETQVGAQSSDVITAKEIHIVNAQGQPMIILNTDEAGEGSFIMSSTKGNLFGLSASDEGMGLSISSVSEGSLASVSMGVSSTGQGAIGIQGAGGGSVTAIVDETGKGVVQTHGPGNKLIWSSEGGSGKLGDLDNDGDVDFQDFLIFSANFGK